MNNTAIVPMKLKQDLDVIQANELIRSRQDDMTLLEAKLIAVTVAQVLKQDTDLRTYTCNISDLADYLCMNKDFMFREIKDTCESIVKKSIYRKLGVDKRGRDNFEIFPWIDYVNYKDGVITIRLSDKLKPFLIGLNKCFTTCGIASLLGLPTPYSMKLLQYINSYQYLVYIPYDEEEEIRISEDEFRFPIEEIKEYFNCKDKYPNTSTRVHEIALV